MKVGSNITDGIKSQLASENVKSVELGQIKGGNAKRMIKDIAVSTATSLVTAPLTGWGLRQNTFPPVAWVAVTDKRVLLYATDIDHKTLGDLIFDAPLDSVKVEYSEGLMKSITIYAVESDEKIVVLNFGMRKSAYISTRDAIKA